MVVAMLVSALLYGESDPIRMRSEPQVSSSGSGTLEGGPGLPVPSPPSPGVKWDVPNVCKPRPAPPEAESHKLGRQIE